MGLRVVAVDMDGVLCSQDKKQPDHAAIELVNKLYSGPDIFLVIHTSRPICTHGMTVDWLREHGVRYHALVMDKLRADVYIDDRNTSLNSEVELMQSRASAAGLTLV